MLVPPENFSMVEEGIYRSSKVDAINISFLKSIDLKAVVWINEEKPPRVVRQFMDESNIRLYHMVNSGVFPEEEENIKLHQEWMVLKPSLISKTIQTILDVDNHNCLIMDASEIIVGVLRCIERWNYSSISNEYRLFANRTSYKVEIFLELINVELVPNSGDIAQEEETSDDTEREEIAVEEVQDPTLSHMLVNHSKSTAIQIQRSGRESMNSQYRGSFLGTSPAMRRLSNEYASRHLSSSRRGSQGYTHSQGAEALIESTSTSVSTSPLSSSFDKLSISTSPQVPKNLLRMAEQRKQEKKRLKEREKEKERDESTVTSTGAAAAAPVTTESWTEPVLKSHSLSITALDSLSYSSSNAHDIHPKNKMGHDRTMNIDTHMGDIHSSIVYNATPTPPPTPQWVLYRSRGDRTQIRRPGSSESSARPMHTTIRVQLPLESRLPRWFHDLRERVEEMSNASA